MKTTQTKAPLHYWLIKSEPSVYSWKRFLKDGSTCWDGVRNFEARNHLRAMHVGDLALFYHSNEGKEIVGVARVIHEAYADPTAPNEDWSVVDVAPVVTFVEPVSLATIKQTPSLASMQLVRRTRLSVSAVTQHEFETILTLGKTSL